ncbi:hypothetical protein JL100_014075 [Skermanella mucosa]|uniref:hypothetical protein n=1 Tax=Skermanella mucosa TaxID=1789672 RepID=UPI00192B054A|nr:hypothetical protein [Skermanella mucosa]UEM23816.1 hypothetical protein JL100_014075 [Skermanella mucosa]
MTEFRERRIPTGQGVRAVALALVFCLLSAFCWTGIPTAPGSAAAPSSPSGGASGSGGGDAGAGERFHLPRQLFVEASRAPLRDPPMPEPIFAVLVAIAFMAAGDLISAPDRLYAPVPVPGMGWASPRIPTGPPVAG